jgi:hypothetical protein
LYQTRTFVAQSRQDMKKVGVVPEENFSAEGPTRPCDVEMSIRQSVVAASAELFNASVVHPARQLSPQSG